MNTFTDLTLSDELQELYLENKEWFSNILFSEDELRFLQSLFGKVLSGKIERESLPKIEMISATLNVILERRKQLKTKLQSRKHELVKLLKGESIEMGLELIKDDAAIINEIHLLMNAEKLIKEDLFTLTIQQKSNQVPIVKSRTLKVPRYPMF